MCVQGVSQSVPNSSRAGRLAVLLGYALGKPIGAALQQQQQLCGGSRQALSCFARLHPLHLPKQVGGDAGTRFVFGDGQASGVVHFVHCDTKSPDLRLLAVQTKTKAHVHAYTQAYKVRRQQIIELCLFRLVRGGNGRWQYNHSD